MEPMSPSLARDRPCRDHDAGLTGFGQANPLALRRTPYSLTRLGSCRRGVDSRHARAAVSTSGEVGAAGLPPVHMQRSVPPTPSTSLRGNVDTPAAPDCFQPTVLTLRFNVGLSDDDIAEHLGRRLGTVRSLTAAAWQQPAAVA